MENRDIARLLNESADLLDIQHENPFRVRSYRKAAQTVEGLSRPLMELINTGQDLTQLPGIGSSMAEHIREILRTGTLAALPGFGRKTADSLHRAIRSYEQHGQRFLLADADHLVQPLLSYLRQAPGLETLEVAGSLWSRRETVGDLDILAICDRSEPFMQHFLTYPHIGRVEMAGVTRGTVVLHSGLQVDLRTMPRQSYGAALYYFTGSKAHNMAVRKLAVEHGLRINEYDISRVPPGRKAEDLGEGEGERIGGETEEDIFRTRAQGAIASSRRYPYQDAPCTSL